MITNLTQDGNVGLSWDPYTQVHKIVRKTKTGKWSSVKTFNGAQFQALLTATGSIDKGIAAVLNKTYVEKKEAVIISKTRPKVTVQKKTDGTVILTNEEPKPRYEYLARAEREEKLNAN